ncbi:hypothetical protein P7D22_13130 [Lichenihabitans sp. Uapishka_5]|uniref:hypothetical protein n=1 Tax=Lichenihabitans sp. Uapishka_5 TaxID=3037302 RepID=UPI0029E82983|nr:hypothetical protein [Lichenihabitans sp. Uapishka_5]MDX7952117.1 hypothetical protein [Lichenihabitans sp. Uapishka_5]
MLKEATWVALSAAAWAALKAAMSVVLSKAMLVVERFATCVVVMLEMIEDTGRSNKRESRTDRAGFTMTAMAPDGAALGLASGAVSRQPTSEKR